VKAFAKVNLCLLLGPPRRDGRHELVTVLESVDLHDSVIVAAADRDEVVCPGVRGPNLVSDALAALREAGWEGPPLRVQIEKRIPVAAGMGGGSADAAALLREASRFAPLPSPTALRIAAALGSDVPSQLQPGVALGTGAGDEVAPLPPLAEHAIVVIPQRFGLSTANVYAEADRLGLPRAPGELDAMRSELQTALAAGGPVPESLLVNDLQPASLSLARPIGAALRALEQAGCEQALVCGSGPTTIGLLWGPGAGARAAEARERLVARHPGALAVEPVLGGDGALAANP
jgi:4-diphosphocytidyl-2-C-methyl-D-erythritol kinase